MESFLIFWVGLLLGLWIGYQSGKEHKKYQGVFMNRWLELIILALFCVFWVWLFYFLKKQDEKGKDKKEKMKKEINDYLIKK